MGERAALPVHWTQNDRDDPRFFSPVTGKGLLHLFSVTVIGSEKIRAYKEQDQVGLFELSVNSLINMGSGGDLAIMPAMDDSHMPQRREVSVKTVPQSFVL